MPAKWKKQYGKMEDRKMKKVYFAILAAASLLAACTDNYKIDTLPSEGDVVTTTFVGNAVMTKISVGEKTGSKYTLLWNEGDVLKIVDASTSAELGTAALVSGAGLAEGTFATTAEITDGTSVKLVYGSDSIAAEQVRPTSADKSLDGFTYAESEAVSFTKGGTVAFQMVHTPAILKISVSSSDFSALKLNRVVVFSKGSVLAGTDSEYAQLTFTTPSALSGTQEAWLATKPITTASEFWVAAELTGTYQGIEGSTVTIPLKFTGKTLQGGKVTSIDLTGLTLAKNALSWYNPVCTRYIPVDGWAYGEANTIVFDPTASATKTVDLRACGNFLNVIRYAKEPKKIQVIIADQVNTGTWTTWSIDGATSAKNTDHALSSVTPTLGRSANAIASSKPSVTGYFVLKDADGNILWAMTAWATSTIGSQTYTCGAEVMNQNLGGEPANSTGVNLARQRSPYFQWGRPFPFLYGNSIQPVDTEYAVNSLAVSASHATSIATYAVKTTTTDWWMADSKTGRQNDLWGNTETTNTSTAGVKSIFDPCPKGWMVVCPAVLKEVCDNAVYGTSPAKGMYYKGDCYPHGAFRSGETASRGSDKCMYFCNAATSGENALHMEAAVSSTDVPSPVAEFKSTWRSNACQIRCMRDASSR